MVLMCGVLIRLLWHCVFWDKISVLTIYFYHLYFHQQQIEKLNLRRMLSSYRNVTTAKTAPILSGGHHNHHHSSSNKRDSENIAIATAPPATTTTTTSTKTSNNHHNKEHSKNQPILPEVGQYVYDNKTGKKYARGKLMGKVRFH